jgi:hypothetical protein
MFTLIQEDTLYKEVKTYTDGYYKRGVYYDGEETITYPTFEGLAEPMGDGSENLALPQGVSSTDTIMVYTSEELNTSEDNGNDATLADVIYINDPETRKGSQKYVVWRDAAWSANASFTLIDSAHDYVCIKEGKL